MAGRRSKAGFTLNMTASISPDSAARFATSGAWVDSPMCPMTSAALSARTYSMNSPAMMPSYSLMSST